MKKGKKWIRSDVAGRILGGSCNLMHLRQEGALRFEKRGNAFHYLSADVKRAALRGKVRTRRRLV